MSLASSLCGGYFSAIIRKEWVSCDFPLIGENVQCIHTLWEGHIHLILLWRESDDLSLLEVHHAKGESNLNIQKVTMTINGPTLSHHL